MKRFAVIAVIAVAFAAAPAATLAATPNNPDCWGAASADLGQTGGMGDHASSFGEPRLGIGNVAELFTGTRQPGDLAAFLGFSCP